MDKLPMQASNTNPPPCPYAATARGITLLEVLIAVGVLSIGLLALASLIPIGKYQLAEGAKLDRGSTLGRSAFRTLQVGQWLRPEMWLYPSQGNVGKPVIVNNVFQQFASAVGSARPPMVPLVLDPLMIGVNNPAYRTNIGGASVGGQQLAQTFPYGVGTGSQGGPESSAPIIPRITLRNVPGRFLAGHSLQPLTPGGADRLFRGTDDLAFNNAVILQESTRVSVSVTGVESQTFVNSGTYPTIQYVGANGITANAISMSNGDYSWLVTIQPDVSQVFGGFSSFSGTFFKANAATTRQFQASVVVFEKRPLAPLVIGATTPGLVNTMQDLNRGERMVWVDFIGRGSVRLRASSSLIRTYGDAARYLKVRSNEWMVVCGRRQSSLPNPYVSSTNGWTETSLHWYRIVASSGQPYAYGGQWFIDAAVVGDDWTQNGAMGSQANLYNDENSFNYNDCQNPPTGIGTLMTGAIAVFTKTITLDGSSLWAER